MVKYGRCNHVVWENDSEDYVLLVIWLKYCWYGIKPIQSINNSYMCFVHIQILLNCARYGCNLPKEVKLPLIEPPGVSWEGLLDLCHQDLHFFPNVLCNDQSEHACPGRLICFQKIRVGTKQDDTRFGDMQINIHNSYLFNSSTPIGSKPER